MDQSDIDLLQRLIDAVAPSGAENALAEIVVNEVAKLGLEAAIDPKGNVVVGDPSAPCQILVTAHLDEIGLMVTSLDPHGTIRVAAHGGVRPYKWGEQPVVILADEHIPAVLSYGCIHSASPYSVSEQARHNPVTFDQAFLFTGRHVPELLSLGVRPGVRVALAPERRKIRIMGDFIISYFLDDRADIFAWLRSMEKLAKGGWPKGLVFAATASEEVGGEGARYIMNRIQPDICIALEIGPTVPEAPFAIDSQPVVWVKDDYSAIHADDLKRVAAAAARLNLRPHYLPLTRGGSDASCSAANGLCARPITLGFPVENSHGLEIMHHECLERLEQLTTALVVELLR